MPQSISQYIFGNSRVIDIVDNLLVDYPGALLLVYEGWADMGPYVPEFPISTEALAQYHACNMGA
jgi:hypothetical protein